MKTRSFLTRTLLVAGLICATPFITNAQQGGGGGGGGGGQGRGMFAGILTQEQQTKIREAMQASQDQMTQLREKLTAAQKEAVTAALAKDANEKTVREKIDAVNKIQADLSILRFKAVKEISSTITAEQKSQLEESGMGYMQLLQPMGGGFGGRGMGGGRRGGGGGGGQ
jgi:Spy/CpxP family protein refolding chaperone